MFETNLLLDKNPLQSKCKVKIVNRKYIYTMHDSTLDFMAISKFIQFVNSITINMPVVLELKNIQIQDKLCYVLLECLCQYLIEQRNIKINLSFKIKRQIDIAGIESSPLNILVDNPTKETLELYIKKFNNDIYHRHYRKLVRTSENKDGIAATKITSEIKTFLKIFNIQQEYSKGITDVLGELLDNGLEHAGKDCLLDIDVSPNYQKTGDPDGVYYGLNIAMLSISDFLIGDKIKLFFNKMENNKWYDKLRTAYNNHCEFWDDNYTSDDFFMMSAFQNGISGRSLTSNTGGTGLTQLISALESKSDAYNCYVISGNRKLKFQQNLLKQDEDEWVGFNPEHDFINEPPYKKIFIKSPIFFPGVAYNLNFILKKEQDNE